MEGDDPRLDFAGPARRAKPVTPNGRYCMSVEMHWRGNCNASDAKAEVAGIGAGKGGRPSAKARPSYVLGLHSVGSNHSMAWLYWFSRGQKKAPPREGARRGGGEVRRTLLAYLLSSTTRKRVPELPPWRLQTLSRMVLSASFWVRRTASSALRTECLLISMMTSPSRRPEA